MNESQKIANTPVSNTGGNSQNSTLLIDTLSLTGKIDNFPSKVAVTDIDVINEYVSHLQINLGLSIEPESKGGMNGYHQAHKLCYTDGRPYVNLGFIAWGGNRGSYQLYLTGEACEYIQMLREGFKSIYELAKLADQKIKRIDIAYDDYDGMHNIEFALDCYDEGLFKIRRTPKITQIGNFLDKHETDGRTVYIGSRDNGKMMRIYEKGKQLGDIHSPWVRWELELKAVDRVIPLDTLLDYSDYFAGSYPVLQNFTVGTVIKAIKTVQKITKIKLEKMTEYAKTGYGRLIYTMKNMNYSPEQIIEKLSKEGVPKRLIVPVPNRSKQEKNSVLTNHHRFDDFHVELQF